MRWEAEVDRMLEGTHPTIECPVPDDLLDAMRVAVVAERAAVRDGKMTHTLIAFSVGAAVGFALAIIAGAS